MSDAGASVVLGRGRLATLWQQGRHFGAMLVGVPDYDAYVRHMTEKHPELAAMTREQFVRSRMEARLGAKTVGKCPC
ncbi:YbdD/YjiX family protein [Perlucidibaca aquatica]|uniref:YbdD/YjiX family protein n=1 Tax=Perlucidibaca aquatica TaxID=1852776 RepID=UPI00083AD40B